MARPRKFNTVEEMQEVVIKLDKIKPNPNNPRLVKDEKFNKLVESLKSFGEKMMPLRPMIVDENNILLGGNMRYKALKELGYKEVPESWVKQVLDLTEEEKQEFIIKDNVGFGAWDWDTLANEWNTDNLEAWGLDMPNFEELEDQIDETDISDSLEITYSIEVKLTSEREQEQLFKELTKQGYSCKILTL